MDPTPPALAFTTFKSLERLERALDNRVRNQEDIQRLRDVEIPDIKRKVAEKQLEAENNARLKVFKKSLAAHGNPEPPAVIDHAPKRRKLTALLDSGPYSTAQWRMDTTPHHPAGPPNAFRPPGQPRSAPVVASCAASRPGGQCGWLNYFGQRPGSGFAMNFDIEDDVYDSRGNGQIPAPMRRSLSGIGLEPCRAIRQSVSHFPRENYKGRPRINIGSVPLAADFRSTTRSWARCPARQCGQGRLLTAIIYQRRVRQPDFGQESSQQAPAAQDATDNEYDSSNLDVFKVKPNFGRDSSQQLFQAASRAVFETSTSPSVRLPAPFSWSSTPPCQVPVVEDATDGEDDASSLNLFKAMPNFDPSVAAGSSQFSMYESRSAASDSDQLTDEGLPTPRDPSKRLQVLGASEVSSLPPSGNVGVGPTSPTPISTTRTRTTPRVPVRTTAICRRPTSRNTRRRHLADPSSSAPARVRRHSHALRCRYVHCTGPLCRLPEVLSPIVAWQIMDIIVEPHVQQPDYEN
ncbi:hypothetical protein DL770_007198 [Monosporascus sp. CRB-9-2]|nr:hypothetical protein DL770_007198 [Monosporascus sp. CRB-9-2]